MGTTGAVLYVKPAMVSTLSVDEISGAVLYVPFRGVSGLYSAAGVRNTAQRNLKSWKPSVMQPLVDKEGRITPYWDRFIDYLIETVLGGANAHTLPQVEASITYSEAQGLVSSLVTAALAQQVQSIAQSAAATREVVQTAALSGAEQIPPVQLQPADTGGAGGDGGGGGGGGDGE